MGNFQTKITLLGFSFILAGCTTPFVEVNVGGEDFANPTGGGGDCWIPCWNGGGAKFAGEGQKARFDRVDSGVDVYHMTLASNGKQVQVYLPPDSKLKNIKSGKTVTVKKIDDFQWEIIPTDDQ